MPRRTYISPGREATHPHGAVIDLAMWPGGWRSVCGNYHVLEDLRGVKSGDNWSATPGFVVLHLAEPRSTRGRAPTKKPLKH